MSYEYVFNVNFRPKFAHGQWHITDEPPNLKYFSAGKMSPSDSNTLFKQKITQGEEILFRAKFQRPKSSRDNDAITIQDVKNLVLFLVQPKRLTTRFIEFFHTETVDIFLNDLVIYFEYFLKLLEFMQIRRDEMQSPDHKTRNLNSNWIEQMLSEYMVQYRLLLARSYSKIILGENDVKQYHHMANNLHKSYSEKDRLYIELFYACCKQFVWIAMHRRVYNEIDYEFDRLFRSEYFQLIRNETKICKSLTAYETRLLYGNINLHLQVFQQKSPLILQLMKIEPKQLKVLWIGERKYGGNNKRMQQLEYEHVTADTQLYMANIQHGILGHPKKFYNTMLELNWTYLRMEKYNENYDPYGLKFQPYLEVPNWIDFHKRSEYVESGYTFLSRKYDESLAAYQRKVWKCKDKLMGMVGDGNLFRDIYKEVNNILR